MAIPLNLNLLFATLAAVVALFIASKIYPWLRRAALLAHLPSPKGSLLSGHMSLIGGHDHHKIMTQWAAQLGGIYRMRLAWVQAVIITDPQLVAVVMDRATEVPKNSAAVYAHFNVLTHAEGKGNIFTSPSDDHWRMVRKGILPAFSPNNLRQGFHHVVQANEQLISILRAKGLNAVVNIDNAAQRITLDVIGRVGFDKDFGATKSLDDESPNRAFSLLEKGRDEGLKRFNNPLRRHLEFLKSVRQGDQDFADFRQIMSDLLIEIRARGPLRDSDMTVAAHLLRIIDPATGRALPDDRIASEIGVLFTGGFETTGHTIAWAIFLISQHPEVEKKVLAELDSLELLVTSKRPQPRTMTYADIANLSYTYNAIKEAMRMYPVTSDGTNRLTVKDTLIGKHLIPKDTMVWVPFAAMFNSPHNFARPSQYLPERWEEPDAEYIAGGKTDPKIRRFMPFSTGTRNCAGQSLARMNYTATVSMLFAAFSFKLADEMGGRKGVDDSASSAFLTLQPLKGLKMHCIPRK